MNCASCGKENRLEARFCDACGAALAVSVKPGREERKVVTVLFADLVGFTSRAERLDPEDVRRLLAPYWSRLRDELEHYGGTVEKFIGDAVMAVFGAPRTHEDDPERAVRAALAIRDWAAAEADDLQLRIGVMTGEALVAIDARPAEGEGIASGDVVNTAARLQAAAPVNGILVGEATYRATTDVIDYRRLDSVAVKGKTEPIAVWEALEARSRVAVELARPSTQLVGRRRELAQLFDAFDRAREERAPQLVTLVGVPGIGKSRLVGELFARIEEDPDFIYWRQGRSLPYGDGMAFSALAEMVKAEAGILESDGVGTAEEKLLRSLDTLPLEEHERAFVERSLRPLVGLGGGSETGGDRRAESFAAWRRYLDARSERGPHVLVFEDVHWADDDLLDFVDELADWLEDAPLLVLCTARPELLERRPGWSGGKRNALTVSLAPLSETDTARLIGQLLERPVLPVEEQADLLERIGGNPLFAEQFVRAREALPDGQLPETLQGIIAARLDALSAADKTLLQDAAVVGRSFWAGALAELANADVAEIDGQLQQLVRKEFVRRERHSVVAGEAEYAFAHALIRDVAYGQIPRAHRADRHERAAAWIENLAGDRIDDRADMLAHHYLSALELRRAAGVDTRPLEQPARLAVRQAAERASALGSTRAALALWATAVELWPEGDPDYPGVLYSRSLAAFQTGDAFLDVPGTTEMLERAAAGFQRAGAIETVAEVEAELAALYWTAGLADQRDLHLERATSLIRDRPASAPKATVLAARARFLMLSGRYDEGRDAAQEALSLATELGLDRIRAAILITLGAMSDGEDAITLPKQGLELALALNDSAQAARGFNNLVDGIFRVGTLSEVPAVYAEARRWMERYGGPGHVVWIAGQEAGYHYIVGAWDRALESVAEFLRGVDESAGGHYLLAQVLEIRGLIGYGRGQTDSALADLRRCAELATAAQDPQSVLPSFSELGRVLLAECDLEAARAVAARLRRTRLTYWNGVVPLAIFLVRLGEGDELVRMLSEADPLHRSTTWFRAGEAIARGELAAAAEVLGESGSRTEEAQVRLLAAEQLVAAGRRREADDQLGAALAFFRSVGATRWTRDAEVLLAQPA